MQTVIRSVSELGLVIRAVRRASKVRLDDLAATAGVSAIVTVTMAATKAVSEGQSARTAEAEAKSTNEMPDLVSSGAPRMPGS